MGGVYGTVLALGDLQYECGGSAAFGVSYDPSWGRVKSITRPAIGNHEYETTGGTDCDASGQAKGYFDYFNGAGNQSGAAGDRTKGYYSYDIGSWHIVVLNSECAIVSCAAGSAQELWLKNDLQTHPSSCTLAYWHRQESTPSTPFWADLYDAAADVVLNGHVHDYERFAPQNRTIATYDPVAGVRRFIVGTGGKSHQSTTSLPNAEVKENSTYGVLKLTLHATSYDWQFVPEAGKTFTDSGSAYCHKGLASSADLSLHEVRLARTPSRPASSSPTRSRRRTQAPRARPASPSPTRCPRMSSFELRDAVPGQLLAVGGDGHLLARHARRRRERERRRQGHAPERGHDHQPGERRRPGVADPDSTNNAASADTTVNPSADLSLTSPTHRTRSGGPAPHLHAHGAEPRSSERDRRHVTDTLPAGVSFDSATPSQGSCSQVAAARSPARSARSPAATSATVDVKVKPQATGTITNQASVSSAVTDPTRPTTASADTTVNASPASAPQANTATDPARHRVRRLHESERVPRPPARISIVRASRTGFQLSHGWDP